MNSKQGSFALRFARSMALGILLSMVFFYSIHVFGTWKVENYRPDPETTYTVLLHNKCAVLGSEHTLRPNTDVSNLGEKIDGTKLTGSFMNFLDGHIPAILVISLLVGGVIFLLRNKQVTRV